MSATKKQTDYIKSLKAKKLDKVLQSAGYFSPQEFAEAMYTANMPDPKDKVDASAQIDALKGNVAKYNDKETGEALMALGNAGFEAKYQEAKELIRSTVDYYAKVMDILVIK